MRHADDEAVGEKGAGEGAGRDRAGAGRDRDKGREAGKILKNDDNEEAEGTS